MTIFDILLVAIIAMFVVRFLNPRLRENKQFNYALAGVVGLKGAMDLTIGLKFDNKILLAFGVLWLIYSYYFYQKAQRL